MLVVWIWVYGDLASYPYSRRSSTWLNTLSIGACGSYCIDLMLCSRSISWLGEIFAYVTIKYWMSMKRLALNWSVVLFLMAVKYFSSTANTSFWMSTRSNLLVSWKTRTPVSRPPCIDPPPFGHLSRWGRCSIPDQLPKNLVGVSVGSVPIQPGGQRLDFLFGDTLMDEGLRAFFGQIDSGAEPSPRDGAPRPSGGSMRIGTVHFLH